jgi:hypothetical protein
LVISIGRSQEQRKAATTLEVITACVVSALRFPEDQSRWVGAGG